MMVYDGLRWFMMVYDVSTEFMMVYDDSTEFMMVWINLRLFVIFGKICNIFRHFVEQNVFSSFLSRSSAAVCV